MVAIILYLGMLVQANVFAGENKAPEMNSSVHAISVEMENELQVEGWMVDLGSWCGANVLNKSVEDELSVEDWMIHANEKYWEVSTSVKSSYEPEFGVEDWMTDLSQW